MKFVADPTQRSRSPGAVRGALLVCGTVLLLSTFAGCASVIEKLPVEVGGLPADAPQRQEAPIAYPAVHDMPPPRSNAVLTEDEQKKAAAALAAARDQQAKQAAAKD